MPGGVEAVGCFAVGVIVEETVEQGERVGVGLAGLCRGRGDRDGEAGGLPAAEADVEMDLFGLDDRDVFDEEAGHAFSFALWCRGVGP